MKKVVWFFVGLVLGAVLLGAAVETPKIYSGTIHLERLPGGIGHPEVPVVYKAEKPAGISCVTDGSWVNCYVLTVKP